MVEKWQVRLSGTGGQGIIKAAMILAQAALSDGNTAVQSQVYGPESRGGATQGEVVISNGPIYYPKVIKPNFVLCLSPQAYQKFGNDVAPGGILMVDSHIENAAAPAGVTLLQLPVISVARNQIGNEICTNIVALGAIQGATDMVNDAVLQQAIVASFKAKAKEINLKAFAAGQALVQK